MYTWEKGATICYAYPADVVYRHHQSIERDLEDMELGVPPDGTLDSIWNHEPFDEVLNQIEASRWFTREWTLQDLFTPKPLAFCTTNWEFLGLKNVDLSRPSP